MRGMRGRSVCELHERPAPFPSPSRPKSVLSSLSVPPLQPAPGLGGAPSSSRRFLRTSSSVQFPHAEQRFRSASYLRNAFDYRCRFPSRTSAGARPAHFGRGYNGSKTTDIVRPVSAPVVRSQREDLCEAPHCVYHAASRDLPDERFVRESRRTAHLHTKVLYSRARRGSHTADSPSRPE